MKLVADALEASRMTCNGAFCCMVDGARGAFAKIVVSQGIIRPAINPFSYDGMTEPEYSQQNDRCSYAPFED